jgi:hypothetical protein
MNRQGWQGFWTLQRPKYGACGGVREVDIASQGMRASIGNPISKLLAEAQSDILCSPEDALMVDPGKCKLTAAPPAIVPSKQLLISMTFLTV